MLFDAARAGSAASMICLAAKKAARTIYLRHRSVENFFIIVPATRSDRSRTSDAKRFRFRKFPPRNEFSISMRLRGRLQFPRPRKRLPRSYVLQRVHCFSSNKVRVVTFAQRRENDSV